MGGQHDETATSTLLSWGERVLRCASVDTARLESHVLLACAAGVRRDEIMAGLVERVDPAGAARFRRMILRRAEREPLAYVRGYQEFYGLRFEVDASTLVPRPETELLVDSALRALAEQGAPSRVVDVCTGSGCVAIAVAARCDGATVWASDSSAAALAVAKRNVERHDVGRRVQLVRADLLRGFAAESCDTVVANPPYIPAGEIDGLQAEIARYEPRSALDGGMDGLDYQRRLVAEGWVVLRSGGMLLLEVGAGQSLSVAGCMEARGYRSIGVLRDLAGIERVVCGVKPI